MTNDPVLIAFTPSALNLAAVPLDGRIILLEPEYAGEGSDIGEEQLVRDVPKVG
jgi:hypothetical protein